jgi:hypothetical protein
MLATVPYMPETCAYRLIYEKKDLPEWHHLICGDRDRVHAEGHSVRGQTVSESQVKEWEDQIVDI